MEDGKLRRAWPSEFWIYSVCAFMRLELSWEVLFAIIPPFSPRDSVDSPLKTDNLSLVYFDGKRLD